MRYFFFLIIFSFFSTFTYAQNYDFPKNPDVGKCYERCFTYDKPFEWKKVDCDVIKERKKNRPDTIVLNRAKLIKQQIKLKKYQEKLNNLGYEVEVTGLLNNETINAHHKYLKLKAKEERVKARLERKAKRKNRN